MRLLYEDDMSDHDMNEFGKIGWRLAGIETTSAPRYWMVRELPPDPEKP